MTTSYLGCSPVISEVALFRVIVQLGKVQKVVYYDNFPNLPLKVYLVRPSITTWIPCSLSNHISAYQVLSCCLSFNTLSRWWRRSTSCPLGDTSRPSLRRLHSSNDLTDALGLIDLVDVKEGVQSGPAQEEIRPRSRHTRMFSLSKRKARGGDSKVERPRVRKRPKSEYSMTKAWTLGTLKLKPNP